jgi:hypothetical protein
MSLITRSLAILVLVAMVAAAIGCAPTPPAPTPTPAPTVKPTPTPTATVSPVKFQFTWPKAETDKAAQNGPVAVAAQTEPNAECTIQMWYTESSGGSESKVTFANATQKADASGAVKWDGFLNARAYAGKTKLLVTVKSGANTATFTSYFTIVEAAPPTATPTPTASPSPTAPPKPTDLFIEVVSVLSPTREDAPQKVVIKTLPGAKGFIQPYLPKKSDGSRTISIYPPDKSGTDGTGKPADENGIITWEWTSGRMNKGDGYYDIKVVLGDKVVEKKGVVYISD